MEKGNHTMKGSMHTNRRWIMVGVAAMLGQLAAPAQDWQTVDDFVLGSGNAEAHGVAVDAAGGIYVVGTANGHGIVRYSTDGGTTWTTRDDSATNAFNAITINHQGDLFVGGASGNHWIVQRSTDQGATWETVDDYYRPMIDPSHPGTNGVVFSLSTDGQGRVYGAGRMHPTGPSYNYWWVRGSDIGGTNWDTKLLLFSAYADVSQLTWAGEDVYVTGETADGSGASTGLILRSGDNGASWTTNFQSVTESYSAITSDPGGNIYAAGIEPSSNSTNWLVRKAAPGGTNWTIFDQFSSSGAPNSIAIDAARSICVAGRSLNYNIYTNSGGTHYDSNWSWVTRQYSVASDHWNTDAFSYSSNPTNMHAAAMGTAIAHDGSTFVVGYGSTESGQRHWVVRKRAAVHPPQLQIALGNGSVTVSWPAAYTNSTLEWTASQGANQLWQPFTGTMSVAGTQNTATLALTSGARFFRLKNATDR